MDIWKWSKLNSKLLKSYQTNVKREEKKEKNDEELAKWNLTMKDN